MEIIDKYQYRYIYIASNRIWTYTKGLEDLCPIH